MFTLCWAAKGGSGTTVVTAAMALASTEPTLLVDLAGDLPMVFGLAEPDGPGVLDWLRSEAEPDRLATLELPVDGHISLLPAGRRGDPDPQPERWIQMARWLRHDRRRIIVDAGSPSPPPAVREASDHAFLVTRPCYLALRTAIRQAARPSGVIVVDEPGRALSHSDIERCLGAPVVARVLIDPAIARAVDAGLLVSRLPRGLQNALRAAAA